MEHVLSSPKTKIENTMSFDKVAKEVIKNSIRSAVCIDDDYPSAYQEENGLKKEEASKLYNSFRNIGTCDLDIYNFESLQKSWRKDFMIPNKDLIILDWELSKSTSEEKYKDTLTILSDIINSKQIPFVVIYTQTPDINEVSRTLIKEFYLIPYKPEDLLLALKEKLNECNPTEELEIDNIIEEESILKLFYEYVHNFTERVATKNAILNHIKTILQLNSTIKIIDRKLKQTLSSFIGDEKDYLIPLSLFSLAQNSDREIRYHIERVESQSNIYRIGTTDILICRKELAPEDGVHPEELFNIFSEAIISNPHNYISLLALELKDQIRTEFSKIGSKFAQIDEKAFFYHMRNYRNKDQTSFNLEKINSFILRSWLEDFHSFRFDAKSKVISKIKDAYDAVNDKIPNTLDDAQIVNSLVKYSALLSTNNSRQERKELRFGDVFFEEKSSEYFMCITPHCDCVKPEKIENNYYFVKGKVVKNIIAVKNAETGHYSFLNINDIIISIEWKTRPFTLHIVENDINKIAFNYSGVDKTLVFCTTQKENFTQRISNESFGYGYRVGIDLPHEVSSKEV